MIPRIIAMAGLALASAIGTARAAEAVLTSFDSDVAGWYYQNWNNSPGSFVFSTDDANGSATSGSMKMTTFFNVTTNGGAYRLPLSGGGPSGGFVASAYSTLEYDVKVDPASPVDQYGNAADFKVGFMVTSAYTYRANDLNIAPVATNNGWQHISIPFASISGLTTTELGDVREVFIQQYDNNYLGDATNIMYIDNIKVTGPDPTYPDYNAFGGFPDPASTFSAATNWYGGPVAVSWSTNDAEGNPNSGSAYIGGTFAPNDNNVIISYGFDTNISVNNFPAGATNIDGTHFTAVELDVMWDTNSTIDLSFFNARGDVNGFPLGLMVGQDFGVTINNGIKPFGDTAPSIPDAASNGWVHMSLPLNRTAAGLVDTVGLYFKKYNGTSTTGSYGFWIDNVKFIGAPIAPDQPTMSISKPVLGLNLLATGNAGNASYDRESLVTYDVNFSFVDQPNPVTYSMTIADYPKPPYSGHHAHFFFVPNGAAVEAAPDWDEANILVGEIQRTAGGAVQFQLQAKTNQPTGNGSLYIAGNPTFVSSKITGQWLVTFLSNTNIFVKAPDGTSTNLSFPLGLTPSDVTSFFGTGQMVVYFGGQNNGGANIGQRIVLSSVGVTNGSSTLLYDNFLEDTVIDDVQAGGLKWLIASDANTPANAIFLMSPTIRYFVDWSVPANGFTLQTNSNLTTAWGDPGVTTRQLGDHVHTEFDVTNLPPSGPLYFRVVNPNF